MVLKLAPLLAVVFLLTSHGSAARCRDDKPRVQQTQVGFGEPPRFVVVVQNSCPMCPAVDVHINCGGFPQSLADPKVLMVIGYDDCVVNGGLPLAPLQKLSFNYTHERFGMSPKSWFLQCE
ncbi:unnamed protein product [Musa acuminata subsp. malaccensis]|uniref:(wild Malaysian banana) hypothetical protein n=1 Tax=Musa acuminata subsp. malaccensis TaxID=214687 RepID=A0A804KD84_MUSAM|nr:PREDICTED: uncharacterized protein At1g05835 [Musa acuminata subsp. malaccensis]CAG1833388.1 unnamed protein product [Musa acuminata subsp. malaccensis]